MDLIVAVNNRDIENVKKVLEQCGKNDTRLHEGKNIVHYATECCEVGFFVSFLNLLKSDDLMFLILKTDDWGRTAFDLAMEKGQFDKFKVMLELLDDLNIPRDSVLWDSNEIGDNILHRAVKSCSEDFFVCLLELLKSEPDKLKTIIFKQKYKGFTPIDLTMKYNQLNKFKIMSKLLDDLNISKEIVFWEGNKSGKNILHRAAKLNCDKGFYVHLLNSIKSEPEKLKTVLFKKDNRGFTPFDIIVQHNEFEIFKTMLEFLEDSHISKDVLLWNENLNDENILHHAAGSNFDKDFYIYLTNLLKSEPEKLKSVILKKNNYDQTPVDMIVINSNLENFKIILELIDDLQISQDIVFWNENGSNILHNVARSDVDVDFFIHLMNLLKNNPDKLKIQLTKKDYDGNTPVDLMSSFNQLKNFKILLKYLDDLQITIDNIVWNENENSDNILHHAAGSYVDEEFLIYFISINSDKFESRLLKRNNDGQSAIDLIVKYGQLKKFEIVLKFLDDLKITRDIILWNENENAENILHFAAGPDFDEDFFVYLLNLLKENPEKLKSLLSKRDNEDQTPLDIIEKHQLQEKHQHILNLLDELHISI